MSADKKNFRERTDLEIMGALHGVARDNPDEAAILFDAVGELIWRRKQSEIRKNARAKRRQTDKVSVKAMPLTDDEILKVLSGKKTAFVFPYVEQEMRTTGMLSKYGKEGGYIWVRETWGYRTKWDNNDSEQNGFSVVFRAGSSADLCEKWNAPVGMKRNQSRITLHIENMKKINAEMVSEEALLKMGFESQNVGEPIDLFSMSDYEVLRSEFKDWFSERFNKEIYSGEDIPLVYFEVKVIKSNIDEVLNSLKGG